MKTRFKHNRNTATAVALTMTLGAQTLAPTFAFAGNGSIDANGGDNPSIAYTDEQISKIDQAMSLDYLKLTPDQIKDRDKKLAPIYDYYRQATEAKVMQQIEATFGTSVYHFQSTRHGLYTANLNNKKGTMDSVIRYYTNYGLEGTPFENASPNALPGKGTVAINYAKLELRQTSNSSKFSKEIETTPYYSEAYRTPFLINTTKEASCSTDWLRNQWCDYAIYTTTGSGLFEVPVLDNFLSAMRDSELKALDATVVFASGTVDRRVSYEEVYDYNGRLVKNWKTVPTATQVVYPSYSRIAPIPQPIIFVSRDASEDDILAMLNEHAPRIFAYNQLFNQKMLPEAAEVSKLLAKYPDVLAEVQAATKSTDKENQRMAITRAYLYVSYGMIVTGMPVTGLSMIMANPKTRAILIKQLSQN